MFTPEENRGIGERELSPVDAKYEELRQARLRKMEIEKKIGTPLPFREAEQVEKEYDDAANKVAILESEFEAMKAAHKTELDKKFGNTAANLDAYEKGVTEGSDDDYLLRRLDDDERKAA